jgi:hypothetical protein
MGTLFSLLNLAAMFAGILSFIVGLYSLPRDKQRAVKYFVGFFIALVVFGVAFFYGNELLPANQSSVQDKHAEPPTGGQSPPHGNLRAETPAAMTAPVGPVPRMASIQGIVYSRSKERWGGPYMGPSYPDVNLVFSSGLVIAPSDIRWRASYQFERDKVCLSISNLAVPTQVPIMADYYRDFEVGYAVELENAAFTDYTMARTIMLYRSFVGDTPQKVISKCFPIITLAEKPETVIDIHGQWEGAYFAADDSAYTPIQLRFVQNGNRISGSMLDSGLDQRGQPTKSRWDIDGWLIDGKITFIKRNAKLSVVGISYVAPCSAATRELAGEWYAGAGRGTWKMKYEGDFSGSSTELLNLQGSNPPEKPVNPR